MGLFVFTLGICGFVVLSFIVVLWVGSLLFNKFYKSPIPLYEELSKALLRLNDIEHKEKN